MIVKWRAPSTKAVEWIDYIFLFSILGGMISAVVCVITTFSALAGSKVTHHRDASDSH